MSAAGSLFQKLQVTTLSSNFRAAVSITKCPIVAPAANEIRVQNKYAGINATDINISAGRYFTDGKVPFDVGFEGLGTIDAVGSEVKNLAVGQNVLYIGSRGFGQVIYAKPEELIPVPDTRPEFIATLVCGLTATIGLDVAGRIKQGDKVLITAAAGGTGHIAVQWAKSKGCHVIGLTSNDTKAAFLKSIGVDDVINYKTEDLDSTLKTKYPDGIDVIWETIGGKTLEMLITHLAIKGRIVIVGGITGYKSVGFPAVELSTLPSFLLMGSRSMTGFFLMNEAQNFPEYLGKLIPMVASGQMKIQIDRGENSEGGKFLGLDGVIRGVEHLHSGKNQGKVVVEIQ